MLQPLAARVTGESIYVALKSKADKDCEAVSGLSRCSLKRTNHQTLVTLPDCSGVIAFTPICSILQRPQQCQKQ